MNRRPTGLNERFRALVYAPGDYFKPHFDGSFVRNPESSCQEGFEVLPATSEIVDQFSKLLRRISESALDHSITQDEAKTIRNSWDKLKCYAEGFVRCCEEGDFEAIEKAEKHEEPKVRKTLY